MCRRVYSYINDDPDSFENLSTKLKCVSIIFIPYNRIHIVFKKLTSISEYIKNIVYLILIK